ncbi:unnamed protein product [Pleuronectes platessa]|uniref:Uncharacterized protein n=1 Tax=Pleuronectes platessa TaxID=8262 RepID=A0A9N7VXH0_PLEPL|nr:unnamed protein product [Pleuronectes platessa]
MLNTSERKRITEVEKRQGGRGGASQQTSELVRPPPPVSVHWRRFTMGSAKSFFEPLPHNTEVQCRLCPSARDTTASRRNTGSQTQLETNKAVIDAGQNTATAVTVCRAHFLHRPPPCYFMRAGGVRVCGGGKNHLDSVHRPSLKCLEPSTASTEPTVSLPAKTEPDLPTKS